MKKSILLLGAAIFALAGCSTATSSEITSEEVTTSTSEVSSTAPKKDFSSSEWGQEAAEACYDTLHGVIPYITCDSFEYSTGVDDYGDPMITFYLYFSTDDLASAAFTEYANICAKNMYAVNVGENTYVDYDTLTYYTFPILYADCLVGKNKGLEIVGTPSTYNEKPCLGLFCYNYLYIPEDEFPEMAIEEILGEDNKVPTLDNEDYTYDFQFFIEEDYNSKCLTIAVYNCDISLEQEYFEEMIANDWYIMACNDDDETYERAKEYPGFVYNQYFYCTNPDAIVIFSYSFDYSAFIIEVYQRPSDI